MEGDAGPLLFRVLSEAAAAAGVEVVCDARVTSLIQDDAGRVVGAIAQRFGREQAFLARRGVVLSAGGFAMNPDMLRLHAPELLRPGVVPIGNPHDDGSGIQLGSAAGGAAIHMDACFVSVPFYPPSSHTRGIFVNAHGQRFVAEDSYHGRVGDQCRRQPDGRAYLILDDSCYEPSEGGREVLAVEDTLEALERALGLPEASLQNTAAFFNRHAALGEDPLFHKSREWLAPLAKPPFAALECSFGRTWYPAFTLGGLRTRASGEVLTEAGEIVPGLFAAGRNACNIPRSASGYASGTCVGDATFFGRLAGRGAAAAAPWK
jgi:succinate dehydrogenase/fumarate reductase flavoprotein subunit